MTSAGAARAIALACVALLAIVLGLAVASFADGSEAEERTPSAVGEWYSAVAGTYRPEAAADADVTACGYPADETTPGVAHPVLPCGAKIVVEYEGKQVLTQVVDRGTGLPGREFDLTAKLASQLGLRGVQRIRWAYAG